MEGNIVDCGFVYTAAKAAVPPPVERDCGVAPPQAPKAAVPPAARPAPYEAGPDGPEGTEAPEAPKVRDNPPQRKK